VRAAGLSGFAERWNGLRWSRVKVPLARGEVLLNVACTGPSHCLVVGHEGIQPIVLSWNGRSMATARTQHVTAGGVLSAIALTGGFGVAVGFSNGTGSRAGSSLIEMQT
jgi:hypothetical protein